MSVKYGDWGRDAVIAVSQRHLGWRLMEVVREIPGLKYPAAAQAAKRFWLGVEADPEKQSFVDAIRRGPSWNETPATEPSGKVSG